MNSTIVCTKVVECVYPGLEHLKVDANAQRGHLAETGPW